MHMSTRGDCLNYVGAIIAWPLLCFLYFGNSSVTGSINSHVCMRLLVYMHTCIPSTPIWTHITNYIVAPPIVRPASPLPPNVPTGPRNPGKYKDRDNNGPAVDGLDYGGTNKDGGAGGGRSSGEPEDRSSSRKRRNSPGLEDGRSSKRR